LAPELDATSREVDVEIPSCGAGARRAFEPIDPLHVGCAEAVDRADEENAPFDRRLSLVSFDLLSTEQRPEDFAGLEVRERVSTQTRTRP
jgi:hypothetical protein